MKISENEISETKQIGTDGQDTVYMTRLVGGLHMVMVMRKGKAYTLGMGSHPSVAIEIASQRCAQQNRTLRLDRVAKSERLDRALMVDSVLERYKRLTEEAVAAEEK